MAYSEASREAVLDQVVEVAERVGSAEGIEIVDVEWKGGGGHRLLRIYIDRPAGVSLADCEFMSKQVGTILDMEDVIPGARYTLEVSSPGLERKLRKPADFERFVGRKVKVVLREPVTDRRTWEGTLVRFADDLITLEPAAGETIDFRLDAVERANLRFDW